MNNIQRPKGTTDEYNKRKLSEKNGSNEFKINKNFANLKTQNFEPLKVNGQNATDVEVLIFMGKEIKEGRANTTGIDPKILMVATEFYEAIETKQATKQELDKELQLMLDYSSYKKPKIQREGLGA